MFNNVYPHIWMALPKDIREHLVKVFDIKKTGISEIRDQELVSDGYSNEDLKAITLEKMNAYIGSEETFPRAWEITCMKAKYELNPPIPMQPNPPVPEKLETEEIINTPHVTKTKKSK